MPKPIVSEKLIVFDGDQPDASAESVISLLCGRLEAEGYVGPLYRQAVLDREARFPTALPTLPFATAIPHGDSVDVRETGVAVAILDRPVSFHSMDTPEQTLPVRAVLLMAVAHANEHVPTLQWVCEMLNRQDLVEALVSSRSPAQAMSLLSTLVNRAQGQPPDAAKTSNGKSKEQP